MSLQSLERQVHSAVAKCLHDAQLHFQQKFYFDALDLDLRGRAAGQFVVKRSAFRGETFSLRFNKSILLSYGNDFIEEVVPHECAHLVVFQYYGARHKGERVLPHGKQWKQVMSEVFGVEPRVRHQFEIQSSQRKAFMYRCSCIDKEHKLSIVRHNKVLRQKAQYQCRVCKTNLRFCEKV